jgi:hypothetical protein
LVRFQIGATRPIRRFSLHFGKSSQAFCGALSAYCFQTKAARGVALIAADESPRCTHEGSRRGRRAFTEGGERGSGAPLSRRVEMVLFLHICQDAGLTEWQTFGT